MDLLYFVFGYYVIVLHADDYKRFFSICTYHGISFLKLNISEEESDTDVLYCKVRCRQYSQLMEIAHKTNVDIQIVKKYGLPVILEGIKLHIWFFIGAVIALFLLIGLSGCIWDIQLDGNQYYGDEVIHRFLNKAEIQSGMKIKDIDCAGLSAMIREEFERVTWASSEIDGCRLIIHIKENRLIESEEEIMDKKAYDLVAEKDGIIDGIFVRNGISRVEPGQSVKKGDILISGIIPILNDAQEIIAYEETVSDGDIMMQCQYFYFHEIQRAWCQTKVIETKEYPVIQIGDYRFENIFPANRGKENETMQYLDNIQEIYPLKITNTFQLPLKTGIQKQIIYEKTEQYYTDSQLKELADNYFQEFCANLEKKGVQIYENNVKMNISDVSCIMSGKVTVIEKAGTLQASHVLEIYGDSMED